MALNYKGDVNLIIFLKTFLFIFLFLTAILIEIIFLPILIIIYLVKRDNSLFIMVSRFIVANGLYFLVTLDLKDFRNKLKQIKKSGRPRIYIMNHSSLFDIILLFLLPDNVKILVKESYTKIPVLGSIIKLNGHITVKSSNSVDDNTNVYDNAILQLKKGTSIVIFPEGTRSRDGNILRFKTGAFKIAYESQADIIPIIIDGWNIIRPGNGIWFREHKLYSTILETLKYEDYRDIEPKEFSKILRVRMATELFKIRDDRKKNEPHYYRNEEKFISIDNEALLKNSSKSIE